MIGRAIGFLRVSRCSRFALGKLKQELYMKAGLLDCWIAGLLDRWMAR